MKRRWLKALLIQATEALAFGALAALSLGLDARLYAALMWAGAPLAGLFSAARAVGRGLNNYAAWIAPPVCLFAAHLAIWMYPPAPGALLLTAFAALVGAAAGEVLRQRDRKRG